MRNTIAIMFATFMFLLSSGLVVNLHYCHDSLVDVDLIAQNADCCCGDAAEADLCCSDNQVQLQTAEEIQAPTTDHSTDFQIEIAPEIKVKPFVLPVPVLNFAHFKESDLPPEDRITRLQKWIFYA